MSTIGFRCIRENINSGGTPSVHIENPIFPRMEPSSTPAKQQPHLAQTSPTSMPPVADMSAAEFRKHGYAVIDWIADYLEAPEKWPVLPGCPSGRSAQRRSRSLRQNRAADGRNPRRFPKADRPRDHALESPGLHGVLRQLLYRRRNARRSADRGTQRQRDAVEDESGRDRARAAHARLAPPNARLARELFGVIGDTASSNTLYALAAAREMHPELGMREDGMSGARGDAEGGRILLGRGPLERRQGGDDARLRSQRTSKNSDRRRGCAWTRRRSPQQSKPIDAPGAFHWRSVATVGTTSTTAIDPCQRSPRYVEQKRCGCTSTHSMAGPRRFCPRCDYVLEGCDRADSLVVNPHKWLFTPMDCSVSVHAPARSAQARIPARRRLSGR